MSNSSSQSVASRQTLDVFVGRQPIFNSKLETYGYELLFRRDETNQTPTINGELATAELILNTFTEIGLEKVTYNLPAFINVTENFLINGHSHALPKERVIIEVLEDVNPTQQVLDALKTLRREGFTIALDDFVRSAKQMPLVELADIVKVELPAIPKHQLAEHVDHLRKCNVKILAEKIETEQEFVFCKELGFDYFQGYFLCRPIVVKQERVSDTSVNAMTLIAKLQQPDVCLDEVITMIETTPALAYKLLRYVNSVSFGLQREIESIRQAVVLLGMQQIKTFIYLVVLVDAAKDQPEEVVKTVLVRAKMAELLGIELNDGQKETFFLVGLLSAMDVLLKLPKDQIMENIPLGENIKDALNHRDGILGTVLNCVLEYEQGNWANVTCGDLEEMVIRDAYVQAVEWANNSHTE